MTIMTLTWIALTVLVVQTPSGYSQWTGFTSYVNVSDASLDMLFMFDASDDEMFEQAKLFTVDTLAAADIDGGLVHVGLVTFSPTYDFLLHERLDNGMNKNTLLNTIRNLAEPAAGTSLPFHMFSAILSEANGGRPYVNNITVVFVSNYSSSHVTLALQALQLTDFDSEVNIIGLRLYNMTDLMAYAHHSYMAENISQLDSFTATTFFNTFTDDCQYDSAPIVTTTVASPSPLEEWSRNTRDNLILDTSTLSSTIRKKTSASDRRTSSALIGYVGFAIVLTTVLLPIIVDIPTFIRHAKLSIKYQKKYRRKMDQLKAK